MDLLKLWQDKHAEGAIRFDPDLLVVRPLASHLLDQWGTVYYSAAREEYKASVSEPGRTASFDLDLMRRVHLADHEDLVIAANPNSLFSGHLVIYPKTRSPELALPDLRAVTGLAASQSGYTFIHNMERSAASVLDWAHFQAYPLQFPIESESTEPLFESPGLLLGRLPDEFPAYALRLDHSDPDLASRWLFEILEMLRGPNTPHGTRVAVNFIWKSETVWVIPRAREQTELAARYFGGLEMGGIFCLPNAASFASYLPHVLRNDIRNASLVCEPETRGWFEAEAVKRLENLV